MASSGVLSTQRGGLRWLHAHLFAIIFALAVCRRLWFSGFLGNSLQGYRCSTGDVFRNMHQKKKGNYAEETDRHELMELGSVSVHWLKAGGAVLFDGRLSRKADNSLPGHMFHFRFWEPFRCNQGQKFNLSQSHIMTWNELEVSLPPKKKKKSCFSFRRQFESWRMCSTMCNKIWVTISFNTPKPLILKNFAFHCW